jgi:hypothetical protein
VDQQDLVIGGFLFLSFGPLADSTLFSYGFGFYNVFVYEYYYSVDPCPSETLRGSNFWFFFLLYFTLSPFVTKNGE